MALVEEAEGLARRRWVEAALLSCLEEGEVVRCCGLEGEVEEEG